MELIIITLDTANYHTFHEVVGSHSFNEYQKVYTASCHTSPSHTSMLTNLLPHEHGCWCERLPFPHITKRFSSLPFKKFLFTVMPNIHPKKWLKWDHGVWWEDRADAPNQLKEVSTYIKDKQNYLCVVNLGDAHSPWDISRHPKYNVSMNNAARLLKDGAVADEVAKSLAWLREAHIRCLRRLVNDVFEFAETVDVPLIITSDHGECFGEDGYFGHGGIVSETICHVPLLVRGINLGINYNTIISQKQLIKLATTEPIVKEEWVVCEGQPLKDSRFDYLSLYARNLSGEVVDWKGEGNTGIDELDNVIEGMKSTYMKMQNRDIMWKFLSNEDDDMVYNEVDYWNQREIPSIWRLSDVHLEQIRFAKSNFVGTNLKILDFGPGTGRMFSAYGKAIQVEGYDISSLHREKIIKESEKYNFKFNLTVEKKIKRLPYRDGYFDYVVSAEVLLHQTHDHILGVMKELARVGKKVIVFAWYEPDKPFDDPYTGKTGLRYSKTGKHCFHYDYPALCKKNNWIIDNFELYKKEIFLVYLGGKI